MPPRVPFKSTTFVLMLAGLAAALITLVIQQQSLRRLRAEALKELASEPLGITGAREKTVIGGRVEPATTIAPGEPAKPAQSPALKDESLQKMAGEIAFLREERETLARQLQNLTAELTDTKSKLPPPEDRQGAYVGPGTWVASDSLTRGITKISLSRMRNGMAIQSWGSCSPTDCDWGEVPIYLLHFDSPSSATNVFVRGFAVWEQVEASKRYMIVTFENSGLRVDYIQVGEYPFATSYRSIERFTRIN